MCTTARSERYWMRQHASWSPRVPGVQPTVNYLPNAEYLILSYSNNAERHTDQMFSQNAPSSGTISPLTHAQCVPNIVQNIFLEMRYNRARCAITHTRWTRDLNYYKVTALAALLFGAHKTGQQTIVYAVRWGRRLCIQLISQHWKSIVNNCPMCAHQITQDIPYNAISKLFFCCLIRHVFFLMYSLHPRTQLNASKDLENPSQSGNQICKYAWASKRYQTLQVNTKRNLRVVFGL